MILIPHSLYFQMAWNSLIFAVVCLSTGVSMCTGVVIIPLQTIIYELIKIIYQQIDSVLRHTLKLSRQCRGVVKLQ